MQIDRAELSDGDYIDIANEVLPGWSRRDNDLAYITFGKAIAQRAAEAAGQDTARLDWLTFNLSGAALRAIGVVWAEHGDARRAIDAARGAQGEQE